MTARVLPLPCVFCCMLASKYISDEGWDVQVLRVVEVNRVLTWKFYLERILPVGLFHGADAALWQCSLPLPHSVLHPDAEGKLIKSLPLSRHILETQAIQQCMHRAVGSTEAV